MRQRIVLLLLCCGLAFASAHAEAKPVVRMGLHASQPSFAAGVPPRFRLDFANLLSEQVRVHLKPEFLVCLVQHRERHATLVMTVALPEALERPLDTRVGLAPSQSKSLDVVGIRFSPLMRGAGKPFSSLEPGSYVAACLHRGLHQKIVVQAGVAIEASFPEGLRVEFEVVAPE